MKPVFLQFCGINSFSEQTKIDFEKLTQNGIFGIFGDTGSGKSTILDCINFALYGRVERSREKLDIINYRCDSAEVKFVFDVVNEGKRKRYAIERSLKKKSGLHKAMLYEDDKCIADNASTATKKITEILGVDAEDFRKCIALPQGEFSQFVKSQPSERIALIERLFSLSKYGDKLKERLKTREAQAEAAYQSINAKLSLYSDVTENTLKEQKAQTEKLNSDIKLLFEECERADSDLLKLKALDEKKTELDEIDKTLSRILQEKPQMEQLRASLKAVPLCKAVAEAEEELEKQSERLLSLVKQSEDTKSLIKREENNLSALSKRSESENYDERIAQCITLAAKYASCEGKSEKLSALSKQLAQKRENYRAGEAKLALLSKELSKAENGVIKAQEKLASFGAQDLRQIIDVQLKGAVLKEEYVSALDYFVGLNGQVKFYKDCSELYGFIERELKQQIDIYRDRVYQVKDFSMEDVRRRLENLQNLGDEREKANAELNERKAALKDAQTAVENCKREVQIIGNEGAEIRKQSDEIKAELDKVFGVDCRDYAAAEKSNAIVLTRLKEEKAKLSADIDSLNKRLATLYARQAAEWAEQKTAVLEQERLKEKLQTLLIQSGFESVQSCLEFYAKFSKVNDAEKALEEYDSKLISLNARRLTLSAFEGLEGYTKQALNDAENIKRDKNARLCEARERLAVLTSDYEKSVLRLSEKNLLLKDFSECEKDRNLIAQLKELTKGNKFMEFIANEYLCDISSLASSTLLKLTDGRYFLTYTDTFYAGDNFNCGNLRGVNTLSGGETFLVSLSLALALSQTICSSLKSIEFFFLDEGFGTLDGNLVDTVMDALEKLKSSRFTIGVISHVEELKHRIDSKITVNKATETHGSTVQISI